MSTATLEKEFYIETADKTGVASQLTSLLSDNGKYNIKSVFGSSYGGKGHFYFILENWSKAKEALSSSEYKNFREEEVVVAYYEDKPGSVTEVTSVLAKAGININWFYTTYYNGKTAVVFSSNDNQKAWKLFNH